MIAHTRRPNLTRVTATIPHDVAEAADRLAEAIGASRSAVLTEALRSYLGAGTGGATRSGPAVAEPGAAPYRADPTPTITEAGDGALLAEVARRLARRAAGGEAAAAVQPGGTAAGTPRIPVDRAALAVLCRRHHIRRLALFGSVLRDDFGPASDVDVLVEFEPGQTVGFEIVTIEEELSLLFGGRRVDLVVEKYLNPRLREGVLAEARVQYAA